MDAHHLAFDPGSYPDVPLYNIQAVSAATNVPAITLRSWERRYGVPKPKRDAKGYRLYSRRDIAIAQWLREQVERGVGISRAVHMLQALPAAGAEMSERATLDADSLRNRLVQAIIQLDESAVSRVVAEALMVAPVEEVVLEIIQPSLYRVGELWARGEISVTVEHFGSNLLRAQIAQLLRLSPSPIRPVTAVVASAPGELHDIGALTLALFLRRRGFNVIFGGASIEARDFIADVRRISPELVCLSASTLDTVQTLGTLFRSLEQDFSGLLTFGGRPFNEHAELRSTVPGRFAGANAAEAARHIEAFLGLSLEVA